MKIDVVIHMLVLILFITSCNQKGSSQAGVNGAREDTLGIRAEKLRSSWQEKIKTMNIKELNEQLKKESLQGMESFNSMTLKETVARGKNSFDELLAEIEGTRSSLLSLLALKEIDNIKYKLLADSLKADILIDALKNAITYNTFGLPHIRWEMAAKAILELDEADRSGLKELLKDRRPALVWGSEDYQEYVRYQYRVCDYAYALLITKGVEPVALDEKPEVRDLLIDKLLIQK